MSLSTPYFIYIFWSYALTFLGLGIFLLITYFQWARSVRQLMHYSPQATCHAELTEIREPMPQDSERSRRGYRRRIRGYFT